MSRWSTYENSIRSTFRDRQDSLPPPPHPTKARLFAYEKYIYFEVLHFRVDCALCGEQVGEAAFARLY